MPDLPTLTVTATQMTRITAAFPGATNAEKADAYKAWLRQAIRDYVMLIDRRTLQTKFESDVAAVDSQVNTDLGSI